MLQIDHETLVVFSKSYGLFYLMAVFAAATAYACWPGNKEKFDRAKHDILDEDDQ